MKAMNETLQQAQPKALELSQRGINNGNEFAQFMSALMSDLIEGNISPNIANAVCNAGGKLLKVVELQHKYGGPSGGEMKTLSLTGK